MIDVLEHLEYKGAVSDMENAVASKWIGISLIAAVLACAGCSNDKTPHSTVHASRSPSVIGSSNAGYTAAAPRAASGVNAGEGDERQGKTEAANAPGLPNRPFPKIGDIIADDGAPLEGGWSYTGGGFYGYGEKDCCFSQYDQLGPSESRLVQSLYVVIEPTERAASGGVSKGRVSLIFYAPIDALEAPFCNIGGRRAVVASADENWRNGSAYVTDGKTLHVTTWRQKAPPGCDRPDDVDEQD